MNGLLLLCALLSTSAPDPQSPTATPDARPRASALRLAADAEAPRIDGRLEEAVWSQAPLLGELRQVEPQEGAWATEATEVRLIVGPRALYIGVRCFDRDPAGICATQMGRDAELDPDDRVELLIDSFGDKRNAFWFQMSPVGSKGDALIANNGSDFNKPWDGVWEGQSSIDGQGWTMELALPWKTLNFEPSKDVWGFNLRRFIKRKNEEVRWAAPNRNQSFFNVGLAGEVGGFAGIEQGLGLDVTPFFVGKWADELGEQESNGEVGLDLAYKLTPSLNALLTINTDFADTEVDDRQVNLTRFPLFFPEKRDFFLQDAGIFRFGDLGNELVPFFSRRIGLDSEGQEVPIDAGVKLTGRQGPWSLGVLDVQTGAQGELAEQNLFVARVTRNVGEQSVLGGIFTAGDPAGEKDSRLYGLDWNYRTSQLAGGRSLTATVFALRAEEGSDSRDDLAFGASLIYPNEVWNWRIAAREIQAGFQPALGFVPRAGVRRYSGRLAYRLRPQDDRLVRRYEFEVQPDVVSDTGDQLESVATKITVLGIKFQSGDEFGLVVTPNREVLDEDFEIEEGIVIPAGTYDFVRTGVEFESALKRPLSAEVGLSSGEFYDGELLELNAALAWRPSRFFSGSLEYEENRVDLPAGSFLTRLVRTRLVTSFSPELSWSNFLQWDNDSDSLGLNSRWRWILAPGREVRLVFNDVVEVEGQSWNSSSSELALKLEYALRF